MKYVPAGAFNMGTIDQYAAQPVHAVKITKGFYMGKYELTTTQWRAIMGAASIVYKDSESNFPAYNVSWNEICDAGGFLEKLNQKNLGKFRLPTEAEWEYACRAGTTTPYYFGNPAGNYLWYQGNANGGNAIIIDTIMVGDNILGGGIFLNPVGMKSPNALGLYDMSGNVEEWCSDWYAPYDSAGPVAAITLSDPKGPISGVATGSYKVLRGGSWRSTGENCGSGIRNWSPAGESNTYRGFRVVMEE